MVKPIARAWAKIGSQSLEDSTWKINCSTPGWWRRSIQFAGSETIRSASIFGFRGIGNHQIGFDLRGRVVAQLINLVQHQGIGKGGVVDENAIHDIPLDPIDVGGDQIKALEKFFPGVD